MASQSPEARIRIIAENLARAALQEAGRDVKDVGAAAGGTVGPFDKLVRSFTTGTGSANAFKNAVQSLSFHAAGIPGPVGKASAAIGAMGLGSGPVLLATAAVGALALGYRVLTRDAREAAEAADKLTESLKRQGASAQLRAIQESLTEAGQGVFAAQSRAQQGPLGGNTILEWNALLKQGALEDAGEKAVAAALAIRDIRADDHLKTIRSLELEARLFGQSAEAQARIRAEAQGFTAAETERLVTATRILERKKEETREIEMQRREIEMQRNLLAEIAAISQAISQDISDFFAGPEGFPTFAQEIIAGIKAPTLADLLAQEGQRQTGLTIAGMGLDTDAIRASIDDTIREGQQNIAEGLADEAAMKRGGMMMASAFVTAVGQFAGGGTAGAFGGIGSLLTGASALKGAPSFLGPVGFAFSAIGSIVSVFDRGQDRRHREAMDKLTRIVENTDKRGQPDKTSVTILLNGREVSGAIVDDVLYAIRRQERLDAVPRLPPR
jgi:hypothetical protein